MKKFFMNCSWNVIAIVIGLMVSKIWECGFYKAAVMIVVISAGIIFWPTVRTFFCFWRFTGERRM
jgi:uncharacterized membrane protein